MNAARANPSAAMAQAANAGMSLIQMIPFPGLNPLNWGALTPSRAMLAAIDAFRLNLRIARGAADAWRNLAREQQDLYLTMLEGQLAERSRGEATADKQAVSSAAAFTPLALLESYSALSRDFLDGQHAAFDSLWTRR